MSTIGETIRHTRKLAGLTQAFVAGRLGISKQYLCDLERDRRGPPPDALLEKLATELDVPLMVLYYRAGRLPPHLVRADASEDAIRLMFGAMYNAMLDCMD